MAPDEIGAPVLKFRGAGAAILLRSWCKRKAALLRQREITGL
jgi:hypothetical protein